MIAVTADVLRRLARIKAAAKAAEAARKAAAARKG